MTVLGVPKRDIHDVMNACATVSAVQSAIGVASGQRVKRSTHVRRYVHPRDEGRGPTRSICTWSNRESGVENVPGEDQVCR